MTNENFKVYDWQVAMLDKLLSDLLAGRKPKIKLLRGASQKRFEERARLAAKATQRFGTPITPTVVENFFNFFPFPYEIKQRNTIRFSLSKTIKHISSVYNIYSS